MTGRHYYACHLTLDDQPQLRKLIARYQQALANLPGLDLIPPEWLHITMQGIGFTDEIGITELRRFTEALTQELGKIDPPTVSFRSLTVHPEAIYLKAHPADALYPLRLECPVPLSTPSERTTLPVTCQPRENSTLTSASPMSTRTVRCSPLPMHREP
jgi:2'-5' RNA ligase superfamily